MFLTLSTIAVVGPSTLARNVVSVCTLLLISNVYYIPRQSGIYQGAVIRVVGHYCFFCHSFLASPEEWALVSCCTLLARGAILRCMLNCAPGSDNTSVVLVVLPGHQCFVAVLERPDGGVGLTYPSGSFRNDKHSAAVNVTRIIHEHVSL